MVTSYFNAGKFRSSKQNYLRFARSLADSGIHLTTVECAFGDDPFDLPSGPDVFQVKGRDILWQKERLINLAVSRLPPEATKVAWLDCDILFTNRGWAKQASAMLDRFPVIQLFDRLIRLARDADAPRGGERWRTSYAFAWRNPWMKLLPGTIRGRNPGMAWAARRSLLDRYGLYDRQILGSGDVLFASAVTGNFHSAIARGRPLARVRSGTHLLGRKLEWLDWIPQLSSLDAGADVEVARKNNSPYVIDKRQFAHFLRWAEPWWHEVRGKVGCVPGTIYHLWHGEKADRQYRSRGAILVRHDFDPATDVCLTKEGLLAWASDKPSLHREVVDYFRSRREDG
ncbi:MAG TPA: hypothetical protein PKK12_01440 [Candidatus Aminicenantes bacterium]|nr:hypothetical protein [Candidatus Aminicenantes bacterium]